MSRIIRVFPRRTNATPIDPLVRVGEPPGLTDEADEIHVSVSFTWDLPLAERLAYQWAPVGPVKIGGPATGEMGADFTPGMYLKHGYTITSRGCPNQCWFCSVWKREGTIRELPIRDGWNVLDDNLLACSDDHIREVFAMLDRQPERPKFTGGLDAALFKPWHASELKRIKAADLFFAYDTPDDLEPLREAGRLLAAVGFTRESRHVRAYVLCGFNGDTEGAAKGRMVETFEAGFYPMAMVHRGKNNKPKSRAWTAFQKVWTRPAFIARLIGTKKTDGRESAQRSFYY